MAGTCSTNGNIYRDIIPASRNSVIQGINSIGPGCFDSLIHPHSLCVVLCIVKSSAHLVPVHKKNMIKIYITY